MCEFHLIVGLEKPWVKKPYQNWGQKSVNLI